MPGPPRTPTHLRLLRGNPSHRAVNHAEPKPSGAMPKPPAGMSRGARAIWRKDAPTLNGLGLLTAIDARAFGAYCSALDRSRELSAQVLKEGLMQRGANGYLGVHPAYYMARAADKEALGIAKEFGLTPSSRSRVAVDEAAKAAADEQERNFQAYLDRKPYVLPIK